MIPYTREQVPADDEDEFWGRYIVKGFLDKVGKQMMCLGFCLSRKDDNLGQWRGYGEDATGISIGFKLDKLLPSNDVISVQNPTLTLSKVHYRSEDTMAFELRQKAEKIVASEKNEKLIEELINISRIPEIQTLKPSKKTKNMIAAEIFAMTKFPFYKVEKFMEEEEWRIVFSLPEEMALKNAFSEAFNKTFQNHKYLDELKFKGYGYCVRKNEQVLHLDMGIANMDDVIESITIGPKAEVSEEYIRCFLRSNGLNKPIKVVKSTIPLQ